MQIKIRSSGKYIEVQILAQNTDYSSGLMSVEGAKVFLRLFNQASADIKHEIEKIENLPSLDQSYQKE